MIYVLMVLLCNGHGANADCGYVPYHGMQYDTEELCHIAMDFVQRVRKPDVAPEMTCIPNRKS